MPFELRDVAMATPFSADALDPADTRQLAADVEALSEERVAELEELRLTADAAATHGDVHPLLTLELGIAVHRAIADVC